MFELLQSDWLISNQVLPCDIIGFPFDMGLLSTGLYLEFPVRFRFLEFRFRFFCGEKFKFFGFFGFSGFTPEGTPKILKIRYFLVFSTNFP